MQARLFVAASLRLAAFGAVAVLGGAPRPTAEELERARIQRHLATVEQELLARDASHLRAGQRAARAQSIARLHEYAASGVFPKNTDFPGRPVPYFVDRFGTRCAMARLIEQSGRGDIVARVAATANNASVPDLRGDPDLAAWLGENGLTLAEAARIQPTYCDVGPCPGDVIEQPPSSVAAPMALLVGGAGLTALAFNAAASQWGISPKLSGALGLAAGALNIAAGVTNLNDERDSKALGAFNVGVGTVSTVFAARALLSRTPARPGGPAVAVAPWLDPRAGSPGFAVEISF